MPYKYQNVKGLKSKVDSLQELVDRGLLTKLAVLSRNSYAGGRRNNNTRI